MGRDSQSRSLVANLTTVTFKNLMWAYSSQNRRNWQFWYKFAQNGYNPKAIFIKFGLEEGVPGPNLQT